MEETKRAPARDYRELRVWEAAHVLAVGCYHATKSFPKDELFGMTSQIRRSASSIPANFAEGCGRGGNDLLRFCRIAMGSAMELDYHLLLARDVGLLTEDLYRELITQATTVRQMLGKLITKLEA